MLSLFSNPNRLRPVSQTVQKIYKDFARYIKKTVVKIAKNITAINKLEKKRDSLSRKFIYTQQFTTEYFKMKNALVKLEQQIASLREYNGILESNMSYTYTHTYVHEIHSIITQYFQHEPFRIKGACRIADRCFNEILNNPCRKTQQQLDAINHRLESMLAPTNKVLAPPCARVCV